MSESNLLNANIVPRPPCEYGIHPETALEEDITKIMRGFGIKRVFSNSLMTEHQVFDMLQFPQHSPVRNNTNVVYANVEQNSEQHLMGSCDEVSLLHEKRFGYKRDLEKAKRVMFVSHTTAITIEHLMQKVETIYTISKTYRNKKERRSNFIYREV